jgi:hypothetical protein
MKLLEDLRHNYPLQKGFARLFAILTISCILLWIVDDQSQGLLVSSWVYALLGIPAAFILILFTLLTMTEPGFTLPAPTSEELEAESLRKVAWEKEAAEDHKLARETEDYLFDLFRCKGIEWEHLRASSMAEDMAGRSYKLAMPLILSHEEFEQLPKNRVLAIELSIEGEKVVVTGFEITSRTLHTYARIFVAQR